LKQMVLIVRRKFQGVDIFVSVFFVSVFFVSENLFQFFSKEKKKIVHSFFHFSEKTFLKFEIFGGLFSENSPPPPKLFKKW